MSRTGVSGWRRALRLCAIFAGMLLVFVLAMTAVYSLPQRRIVNNLKASISMLESEGLRPRVLADQPAYQLDNWSDAQMLDASVATRRGGPLVRAMANDHGRAATEPAGGTDPIGSLAATVAGHRGPATPYARYWHGYQVVLRPALVFFTYGGIRYFNMLGLALLGFTVSVVMYRRAGLEALTAFFFSLVLVGGIIVPMSLEFSPDFYVMLGAVLVVLLLPRGEDGVSRFGLELFLVIGMLTSFGDLLTAPILTLGMPLAMVLVLIGRDGRERGFWRDVLLAVRLSAIWVVGYAGSWVAKWYIASAVLHMDVVESALSQVLVRVGVQQGPRVGGALLLNATSLVPLFPVYTLQSLLSIDAAVAAAIVAPVLVLICVAAWLLVRYRQPSERVRGVLPVLIVAPMPYLWFIVASNHSAVHFWFTYRIQAVAIFAVLYVILACIDWGAVHRRVGRLLSPEAAVANGWIDEKRVVLETRVGFKRAGDEERE